MCMCVNTGGVREGGRERENRAETDSVSLLAL